VREKKIALSQKDFEFVCPVKSADMEGIEGGYFCHDCDKKVYDVSDYTHDEFKVLQASTSDLCINFKKIVTTSLILNATLCVAIDTTKENRLAPVSKITSNQTISVDYNKVVELGGGAVPITIFDEEVDKNIWVPIESPSRKEDDNSTKGNACKKI